MRTSTRHDNWKGADGARRHEACRIHGGLERRAAGLKQDASVTHGPATRVHGLGAKPQGVAGDDGEGRWCDGDTRDRRRGRLLWLLDRQCEGED